MWTTLLLLGHVWLVLTAVAGAALLLTMAVQRVLRRPRSGRASAGQNGTRVAAPPL